MPTVTYRSSAAVRGLCLVAPVLLSLGMVLFLREPISPPRFAINLCVTVAAWAGAVFAFRVRTRVSAGAVEVRRFKTVRLDLSLIARARRTSRGTEAELGDGSCVELPLFLPGVTGAEWVTIDPSIVEAALKGSGKARCTSSQLREVTAGRYLPPGFTGFVADADGRNP